jgi:hypothetical protein
VTRKSAIILLFLLILGLAFIFIAPPASPSQAEPVLSVAGSASQTYPGGETTYRLELLNHTDQIVYDGVLTITLPAGFTYVPGSTIAMGEGWPMASREPTGDGQTLSWGPYHLPAAGIQVHNPYGIHTMMHACQEAPGLHLEGAKMLVGNGGYVKQLFYPIDSSTTGSSQCAINYVVEAYARNLIPILRLQGRFNGVWQAPDPGPDGDYSEIAQAYANFVSGLPRRDTNPLYIEVWNEPDLWIEWSGAPNPVQYARFFMAVSQAIKQLGDARIRVINGALTPGNTAFLDQMLRVPGFKDAFDVWSSHCYPYNHPDSYNNHNGSARYGTYTIDCYTQELALINNYGRTNVKVMLTESGYELGNNTFGFEGFSPVNETNRAAYISGAFSTYWQNWPEVVAVTPFQLSDSSGHWVNFDWVYPYSPYPKHPQFDAVAALPKPTGELRPYGYQIIFRARVDANVEPGSHPSQLSGSERNGHTAFAAEAAPVVVHPFGQQRLTYLPLVTRSPNNTGPWYLSTHQSHPPGAIVPSDFLKSSKQTLASFSTMAEIPALPLPGEPRAIALDEGAGLGAVILANPEDTEGRLQIVDLDRDQLSQIVFLGDTPQMVTTGGPGTARAYVSLADGLAWVDLRAGQVVAKLSGWGRLRGIAYDAATHRLFVADAEHERLLIFSDDLSQQMATLPLTQQPDQVIFDSTTRQLYLSFPAVPQVVAIDTDNLVVTAQASLVGGPLFELAFDADRNRLYALSALAPDYRGITIWHTPTLDPAALVAGAGDFPLRTASAIALTPTGHLLVSETTGLWQITPDDFAISHIYPSANQSPPGGLRVSHSTGIIYMLESQSSLLRIY